MNRFAEKQDKLEKLLKKRLNKDKESQRKLRNHQQQHEQKIYETDNNNEDDEANTNANLKVIFVPKKVSFAF